MKVEETYVSFTRKELYDLLTEMPMTKIAQKYHLVASDLSLRIRDNDIPTRKSGDWVKISMGKKVKRKQLMGNPHTFVMVRRIRSETPNKTRPNKPRLKTTATPLPSTSYPFVYPRIPYPISTPIKKESQSENKNNTTPVEGTTHTKKDKPKNEINPTSRGKSSRVSMDIQMAEEKLEEYDQEQSLYEILNISPNENTYARITIFDLNLPVRALNCLMRSQIENLHKIMSINIESLLELRNLGTVSAYHIIECCKTYFLCHPPKITSSQPITKSDPLPSEYKLLEDEIYRSPIFVKILMELYKLNPIGQEIALSTLKVLSTVEEYKSSTKNNNE